MNDCKMIQEFILTNYVDGEADAQTKKNIDAHLSTCADCRHFAEQIKDELITPFQDAVKESVPESVWLSIQQKIENESEKKEGSFLEKLKESFTLPKLVPALVSFVLLLFIGSTVFYRQQIKAMKETEQGEYLAYVYESVGDSQETEGNSPETPIEEYFL